MYKLILQLYAFIDACDSVGLSQDDYAELKAERIRLWWAIRSVSREAYAKDKRRKGKLTIFYMYKLSLAWTLRGSDRGDARFDNMTYHSNSLAMYRKDLWG